MALPSEVLVVSTCGMMSLNTVMLLKPKETRMLLKARVLLKTVMLLATVMLLKTVTLWKTVVVFHTCVHTLREVGRGGAKGHYVHNFPP